MRDDMRLLILLLLLSMASCGTSRPVPILVEVQDVVIDEIFGEVYDEFMDEAETRGYYADLSNFKGMRVADLSVFGEGVMGVCIHPVGTIYISPKVLGLAEVFQRAVIVHELIHCTFGFTRHTEKGLMGPQLNPDYILNTPWDKVLDEAFSQIDKIYRVEPKG